MDLSFTQDPRVIAIAKALAYAENGGEPNYDKPVAGKTGELASIFQFTPSTWKLYAKQVLGDENIPMNQDTETAVVMGKVKGWLDKGYNVEQIASMWNAGEAKPNAYKENWKGVNKKYGVAFDTPKYASTVNKYYTQFSNGESISKAPEKVAQKSTEVAKTAGGNVVEKLKSLITSGVPHAYAQDKQQYAPTPQNSQNMPMLQPNAPVEQPVKSENSQNMPVLGLLQKALGR